MLNLWLPACSVTGCNLALAVGLGYCSLSGLNPVSSLEQALPHVEGREDIRTGATLPNDAGGNVANLTS